MKRAALALAMACLLVACDPEHNDNDFTPTAPAEAPAVAPGPVQTPAPNPLSAPPGNSAPVLALRTTDRSGTKPLHLTVRMCESSDADLDHLNYLYKWGDNDKEYEEHAGFCSLTHTYRKVGRHRATFCVDDGYPDHQVCDDFIVNVQ